jgi:hypothetical protein
MQIVDSQITMYDIVSDTCHMEINWQEITEGTGHEADETEMKMVSRWRESQITILKNRMKGLETRTKSERHYWIDCKAGCEVGRFF